MKPDEHTTSRIGLLTMLAAFVSLAGVLAVRAYIETSRSNSCKRPSEAGTVAPGAQAARFILYNRSIVLSDAQQKLMNEALSSIPAPCCAKFTLATCCCPCNLAKSVWGLSKHLIAEQHYTAPQVRSAVLKWLWSSNPRGYNGDACFTGGCNRSFENNGCGGMKEGQIL